MLTPVCKPPPALREVVVGAGLAESGGPCSPPGSHCCSLCFKEIPQEIPQQPTNWSRRALEARALAERYACKSDPGTHGQKRLPAQLGVWDGHCFPRRPTLISSLWLPLSLQPPGRRGAGGGGGWESPACLQRQLRAPAEPAGRECDAEGTARAGGWVRGWQQAGGGAGRAPQPLASGRVPVTGLGHGDLASAQQGRAESRQTHRTTALQSGDPERSVLGALKGKPPAFPATSVSGARSPIVISILRGTRGPQVTAASCPLRYEEIQRAQEELGAGVAEVAVEAGRAFAAVQQAKADMAEKLLQVVALGQVSTVQLRLLLASLPEALPVGQRSLPGCEMLSWSLWHL